MDRGRPAWQLARTSSRFGRTAQFWLPLGLRSRRMQGCASTQGTNFEELIWINIYQVSSWLHKILLYRHRNWGRSNFLGQSSYSTVHRKLQHQDKALHQFYTQTQHSNTICFKTRWYTNLFADQVNYQSKANANSGQGPGNYKVLSVGLNAALPKTSQSPLVLNPRILYKTIVQFSVQWDLTAFVV